MKSFVRWLFAVALLCMANLSSAANLPPGYRIEMSPFGGIKDSGLGYKEGVLEAMKSFTNVKTWSLPWPG